VETKLDENGNALSITDKIVCPCDTFNKNYVIDTTLTVRTVAITHQQTMLCTP
jgi:hypothetical protein